VSKSASDQSCEKEGGREQSSPSPDAVTDHERLRDGLRQPDERAKLNNDLNDELQGDLMRESEQEWGLQVPASLTEIDPRSSSANSANSVRQATSESIRSHNSRNPTQKSRKGQNDLKGNNEQYNQILSATEKNIDKGALHYNDVADHGSYRVGREQRSTDKQNSGLSHHKTESRTIVHSTTDDKLGATKQTKPGGGLNFNFVSVSPR
jgi:hypothetical protein